MKPVSEVEKLRALLAEARDYVGVAWGRMSQDGHRDAAEKAGGVAKRIDAALAEPVENWKQAAEIQEQFKLAAMKERDEARAEVERLKALYIEARSDGFKDGLLAADRDFKRKLALSLPEGWNRPDGGAEGD
jgi:hypothetical protein